MQLGFLGLGKMGSRMAGKLLQEGHEVIVWNRSKEPIEEFNHTYENVIANQSELVKQSRKDQQLKVAETVKELVKSLGKPRIIWMMLPAGDATEQILQEILKFTEPNDIIIDGGNAYFKDTERRYHELRTMNIKFLGIGVSGGIIAATNGYPLMAGGDKTAYQYITPILDSLAKPNGPSATASPEACRAGGHAYLGVGGAGHFVKMVHNGIEYGMMQAIAEGFAVMQKSPYYLDLFKVADLWQKGTIVSGLLMDCAAAAVKKDPALQETTGIIPRGGEADWTIQTAQEESVSVENITQARDFRQRSETDQTIQNSFTAKMVNALRHEFGGHEVKKR